MPCVLVVYLGRHVFLHKWILFFRNWEKCFGIKFILTCGRSQDSFQVEGATYGDYNRRDEIKKKVNQKRRD